MENPKEKIYSILQAVALEMGAAPGIEFKVERPKDEQHGDFSSNITLVLFPALRSPSELDESSNASIPAKLGIRSSSATLAKTSSRQTAPRAFNSPMELAEKIVSILNTKYKIQNTDFEKIEAVKPGFINFYLSNKYLQNQVQAIILKGQAFGSLDIGKSKKASVEFVSANPTGPLHIGNARGGPLGDVIANVLSKAGYNVKREYLHNDVGGQIQVFKNTLAFKIGYPRQFPERHPEQDEWYKGGYMEELAVKVKEKLLKKIGKEKYDSLSSKKFEDEVGQLGLEIILEEILKDCKDMGIKFDIIRKESDLRKEVPATLSKLQKFIKEKDGAKWFAPNDEFLKDRETVVKKSDGEYTYFASDIVYHNEKMSENDLVVDILGSNHSGHVPRILAVIKALGYKTENFRCILYQYVRLKRKREIVKMSKRAGTFVTAREVLDEVGKDAFRFFLLTPRTQTHMDFDLELAKKKSAENPVFYVQYAYTRISSIFSKIKNQKSKIKNEYSADLSLLKTKEEIALIRKLFVFPYLVEEVANSFEVNALTAYVLELATAFHRFYEANQVISKDEKLTSARLALLKATQITLKNVLDLLGVSAPEKM